MTLHICPYNNITHKGAIIKPNQCETPQLIHNGIHTPIQDPTKNIIKPSKTFRNLSQPQLQYHINWAILPIACGGRSETVDAMQALACAVMEEK